MALSLALLIVAYAARVGALQRPIRMSPGLLLDRPLAIAVIVGLLLATFLSIALAFLRWHGRQASVGQLVHVFALMVACLVAVFGVGIALIPKIQEPLQSTLMIPPTSTKQFLIQITHPIFFDHGLKRLNVEETALLSKFFTALASC